MGSYSTTQFHVYLTYEFKKQNVQSQDYLIKKTGLNNCRNRGTSQLDFLITAQPQICCTVQCQTGRKTLLVLKLNAVKN